MRAGTRVLIGLVCALAIGCADDFAKYNVISDFRVMGVSSTPAALLPGETATFDVLLSEAADTYRWSWCPLAKNSANGFECAVDDVQIQAALDEALGEEAPQIPPFDLGSGTQASFEYSFTPEQAQGLCLLLIQGGLPEDTEFPPCLEETFDIQIRLDVEKDGKTISSVKTLPLLYDPEGIPNVTPELRGVGLRRDGEDLALAEDGSTSVSRGVLYELTVDVDPGQAESYLEQTEEGAREDSEFLVTTWFVEGGETDRVRTTFYPDESDYEKFVKNEWTPPLAGDFSGEVLRLFFVLRDSRGGTTWIERSVVLEAE